MKTIFRIAAAILYLQYVTSQNYQDLYKKLFNVPEDCNCLPYPYYQRQDPQYADYENGIAYADSSVEIAYVSPEQYQNIYDFITNRLKTAHKSIPSKTEQMTTSKFEEKTTPRPEVSKSWWDFGIPSTSSSERATTKIEELPTKIEETTTVHSVSPQIPVAEMKLPSISKSELGEEAQPVTEKSENEDVQTTKTTVDEAESDANEESNEYDNGDYDKDSEEDRNSAKKPEERITTSQPEDDNNSKPKNIDSWLKF